MNDEIKEILENMKEWSVDGNLYFEINGEKAKLLYDYITKLQEIVYNLTTMTANGDRTQIKNTAQYKLELAQDRIEKAIEYLMSYESIEEIQHCERIKDNKDLDYKTMVEMNRRYLIVHDKLLDILRGEK